jgi:glycosyltransferase involved in cell wall biosynthesis
MISISVVIPCLNEADSIEFCLKKIKKIFNTNKFSFKEIIVVDNGSTDNSVQIAKKYNARILREKKKGYGNSLKTGIKASKGEYVCFADADDSYNFLELKKFIQKAEEGYDLIQGCRFSSNGGNIHKGAMPFTHQYFGNPLLSFLCKMFFKIKFNDVYCGFRMFKKKLYKKNFYFSKNMEFAVEHLIKTSQSSIKPIEIPITLHRDKRKKTSSHLKTFSDGFKTLKFILTCGSQVPLIIISFFLLLVILFDFHQLDEIDRSLFQTRIPITFFIFIQTIFFYLYSSLVSQYLGFKKNSIINNLFKIINFNIAFVISITSFCLSISLYILLIFFNFEFLNLTEIEFFYLLIFLFQILINILFVAVLEFFSKS